MPPGSRLFLGQSLKEERLQNNILKFYRFNKNFEKKWKEEGGERYLEEDDEAGDPEASEEGVVDEVEHCDLQPGQGGSAMLYLYF